MHILVTGATGLIGKNFIRHALSLGHEISALVRDPDSFYMLPKDHVHKWTHDIEPPIASLKNVDAIVHLAGANIVDGRWTERRKKIIVESRVLGTKNLIKGIFRLSIDQRPKILISGSAIGYYGYNRKEVLNERSTAGNGFLAQLCVDWEREAQVAEDLGLRVVYLRTGIVLSREGGALAKMPPIQISSGKNWMSWIHIDDMVRIIMLSLENNSVRGPVNCTAPEPVKNKDFVAELAKAKKVPKIGFVPRFVLDIALGEASNAVVSSLLVQPEKLLALNYKFLNSDLKSALDKELGGKHIFDQYLFKDQFVPLNPEQVFPFFSLAENLEVLTPPWLNFKIISKSTEQIEVGSLIDYKLKIHGVPVKWRTHIKEWKINNSFVDEQLKGPYTKWHHLHTFEKVHGGSLLRDEITYRVPFSILGFLFLSRWISKDVSQIFNYRQNKIIELVDTKKIS